MGAYPVLQYLFQAGTHSHPQTSGCFVSPTSTMMQNLSVPCSTAALGETIAPVQANEQRRIFPFFEYCPILRLGVKLIAGTRFGCQFIGVCSLNECVSAHTVLLQVRLGAISSTRARAYLLLYNPQPSVPDTSFRGRLN